MKSKRLNFCALHLRFLREKKLWSSFFKFHEIYIYINIYSMYRLFTLRYTCWGSGEDFCILSMYFCYFVIISTWKKCWALHLNKLKSPSPKDALCKVWLKLAWRFWRKRFFDFVNKFLLFRFYFPFENKGGALHLNKRESLSPKDALCQVFSLLRNYLPFENDRVLHVNKLNMNPLHPRMLCVKFGWIGPVVL